MTNHASPSHFYQHALQDCLQHQMPLMQRHQLTNGETVWVRRVGPRNSIWRYRILNLIARISGIYLLTPVPNLGGIKALQVEVTRLQALTNAGICVPAILAQTPNAIMISNLGQRTLEKEWRKCKKYPDRLLQRWQLGLNAIAEVHRKQQYLSETFARNMIFIDENHIGFIDFEDDPASVLSLTDCQARDWLCYLHSGARIMMNYHVGEAARQQWLEMLKTQPAAIYHSVHKSLHKIRWMRKLNSPHWGTDTLKLAGMAHFA